METQFKKDFASLSGRPKEAFAWISSVENATFDDLEVEESSFETYSFKVAAAGMQLCHGEFL